MAVPALLNSIEQTGFSTWLRDSDSFFGFYFILLVHTLGLSILVGASVFVDLRLLGVGPELPLDSMKRLFNYMWVGFAVNATTGILLLSAYPTKSLTNITFYAKLSFIALAMLTMLKIKRSVVDPSSTRSEVPAQGKTLAKCSLCLWILAITAGRLLAYTYTYLLYGITALVGFRVHF